MFDPLTPLTPLAPLTPFTPFTLAGAGLHHSFYMPSPPEVSPSSGVFWFGPSGPSGPRAREPDLGSGFCWGFNRFKICEAAAHRYLGYN